MYGGVDSRLEAMTELRFRDDIGRSMFGPCFGARGVLTQIGTKVQCHVCGKSYHHLGCHVSRTHEMSADEYCDEFGLKRTTGLISQKLADKRRRQCAFRSFSPEQQAAIAKSCRAARAANTRPTGLSLESRLSPGYIEKRHKALIAAREAVRQAKVSGTWRAPVFPNARENSAKGRLARRKLDEADPSRVERWKQKLSAVKGGLKMTDDPCTKCGARFLRVKRTHGLRRCQTCRDGRQVSDSHGRREDG